MTEKVAQLRRELKRAIADEKRVQTECPDCHGKGWSLDSTYDRTGAWVECMKCYGTGLPPSAVKICIREAFRKYKKKEPRT